MTQKRATGDIVRGFFYWYNFIKKKGDKAMMEYIARLMDCGYTAEKALKICQDFSKNLKVYDLELFVQSVEEYWAKTHVEEI